MKAELLKTRDTIASRQRPLHGHGDLDLALAKYKIATYLYDNIAALHSDGSCCEVAAVCSSLG